MSRCLLPLALIRLMLVTCLAVPATAARAEVEFASEIAPLLERHCVRCHTPAQRDGDVSLASAEGLEASGAVIPGEAEASYLLELVSPREGEPPAMPKEGPPLEPAEIELVRRWIDEGAPWPADQTLQARELADHQWWSLQPLATSLPPAEEAAHPVDAFVNQRLAAEGLEPVERAAPRTLLRRLAYDLTGLPPTPKQIDRFLEAWEQSPEAAWEAEVDRLLASPAFGEKFGQHWLDLARYAETHGYDKDKPRNEAWPYRDYVIAAFNDDKPYGRFVQEQVAGDALFPGEPDGIRGLGFLAAGPWDFIGHWEVGEQKLDGRIAKHLDRDEMISAVFNVFMSTTVQCAQCHHHKFDPIRMEDYYRLHAVFAAVDRAPRIYRGLSAEQAERRKQLETQITALQQERKADRDRIAEQLAERAGDIDRQLAALQAQHGTTLDPAYGYHSQVSSTPDAVKWVQIDLGEAYPLDHVRLRPAFDQYADIGAGFGFPRRYRLEAGNDPTFQDDSVRVLHDATARDQPNPRSRPIEIDVAGPAVRYLRLTATELGERQNDFIFALGELEAFATGSDQNVALTKPVDALDSIEAPPRWGAKNLTDGIYHVELDDPGALETFYALQDRRAAIEREVRTPETVARLETLDAELADLQKRLKAIPQGEMVYAAATRFSGGGNFQPTEGEPRPIHLLHRGDLRSPGERMKPGAPALWEGADRRVFETADGDAGAARADLARYLTEDDNPLVWRSMANRLWQWTMGLPLVATPNDFGRMGSRPTHPALLDYLATRLRDDPQQSLKGIVRLLVTSEAYRRSSRHDATNATRDAENRFHWRHPRRRLTAEELRDSILAVSGSLRHDERGGPSFQDFVIEKPQHSPHYLYRLHDPEDPAAHRRTIYRFVVRSQPQPMLTTLDCADPSISVPRRDESTTALQALTQWNNRLIEAMSRRFDARLQAEAPSAPGQQVEWACHLVWGRAPSAEERSVLVPLLQTHDGPTLGRVLFNSSAFTYVD